MRHTVETYLAGTAILYAPSYSADGRGGSILSYPSASGTVDARLAPDEFRAREPERVTGGRVAEVSPWILSLPHGSTITETYRVEYASVTYEVSEVLDWTPFSLVKRVRLMEVD